MPNPISFEDFGGQGQPLHFVHANGYPPAGYRPMLQRLSGHFHVYAMHMRPLWPCADPFEIKDWRLLSADIYQFLKEQNFGPILACGHSMGATSTLRLALNSPQLFLSLVLIDPVLLPPIMSHISNILFTLGLSYRWNPLARSARKRREIFESRSAMYENYRSKQVFNRMSDASLAAYVDAQGCASPDGRISLWYPSEWEARIYITGSRADLEIWKRLPELQIPLLVIRGDDSNAFGAHSANLFNKRLPAAKVITIPNASHLVPLEYPLEVADAISDFFVNHRAG